MEELALNLTNLIGKEITPIMFTTILLVILMVVSAAIILWLYVKISDFFSTLSLGKKKKRKKRR